jgi:hypothetical protein
MNNKLYVAFFQSPSTAKRRAVIMTDLPKQKTDLQFLVVQMIEEKNLPTDSILGDIMLLDKTCIDTVQEWMEYKASLEAVYDICIDSMRLPKLGSNKFYTPEQEWTIDPETGMEQREATLNVTAMTENPYRKTMNVGKVDWSGELRKVNQPKEI